MTRVEHFRGKAIVNGSGGKSVFPIIASDVSLSFWGGIDEKTGVVIDTTHPLHGKSVAGTIFCLPSGRGSCTASQVLLELILNGKAPKALVLRDRDGLVSIGALVAQAVFPEAEIPEIIQVDDFNELLSAHLNYGCILDDGSILVGEDREGVRDRAAEESESLPANQGHSIAFTDEEQDMIQKTTNEAERSALNCIIRYARIFSEKPTYVDVEKAHIDGCTYIGPGGLQFVQRLVEEGGSVCIPTTLNSVSTDLRHWDRLGIVPTESQQASIRLADAYVQLGCSEQSFTCAPYLLNDPPTLDEQIVWGESNAVVYANSVLGARTEKYADYLDICCAIVGKVPLLGVHIQENRQPKVLLDVSGIDFGTEDEDAFSFLFPILGHLCGSLSDGDVPILVGLEPYANKITKDHLKAFCAAYGTTGTSPLIHIAGVTPEARQDPQMVAKCERIEEISPTQLMDTYKLLDQEKTNEGNPHLSLSECEELKDQIQNLPEPKTKRDNVRVYACMSRSLYDKSQAIPALRDFGIEFVQDTCWCMLLSPPMIPTDAKSRILTNSGKYAHYGPGLTGRSFRFGSMADCIQAAQTGTLARRPPSSFPWSEKKRMFHTWSPRHGVFGEQVLRRYVRGTNLQRSPRQQLHRVVFNALSKLAKIG